MPGTGNDDTRDDIYAFGSPRPGERLISYRLRPEERPDGIDVRFVIRVTSGDRAKEIDARQTEAIMAALRWYRDQGQQHEQPRQHQAGPPAGPGLGPGRRPAGYPQEMR
ncbi:MAG: hypothetical protein ACRDPY_40940 [Streptosporangiaceae bacterium]